MPTTADALSVLFVEPPAVGAEADLRAALIEAGVHPLPSDGRLALALALLDAMRSVGEACVAGWTEAAPPRSVAASVQAAVLANPRLEFLHALVPMGEGDPDHATLAELRASPDRFPGPGGLSLPDGLSMPALRAPDSAEDQVRLALELWGELLTPVVRTRLLRALDVRKEETALRAPGPGPAEGPLAGPGVGPGDPEAAEDPRFTEDRDWMPSLVLIAKQTAVWLHQLSRRAGRPIRTLDAVPDEALADLARRGITGLWLIGLWERSPASQEIKRRMGNPEALASAYSLVDYSIARGFGGEEALRVLKARAWAHGIRLAADMVPNHVGIDGRWVIEHPERFVQSTEPPFRAYSFQGPDLSRDPRVELRLEDGYWDQTDASVVFERVDTATGERRYLFHGNDGTTMPWNDTAQLDFLRADTREAVIEAILSVARRFPVIRFDAAMTLARRHVRRLWHPTPGEGGAIPSRARLAVSPEEFDRLMPREFWREVVERVGAECPDTLLLAEAFWMMEGYFVRNLGMHRVYNSAFMHMLRDEDNAGFRAVLTEVLRTGPAILERFVNFMNNPDEESAVDQFGRGDKYFGVCTLLATLPGLPMFGHGQFEGFAEKYGMEYARAYRDEAVDAGLLAYHERVITPLLRERRLFSGVKDFALYDLLRDGGGIDENVYAYSNRGPDGRRALVLYNNAYQSTSGRLRRSVPIAVDAREGGRLRTRTLQEALGLRAEPTTFYGLYEQRTERWFLRRGDELAERGLTVDLPGYGCRVFLEWRELEDHDGGWARLWKRLGGSGVPDLWAERDAAERPLAGPPRTEPAEAPREDEPEGDGPERPGAVPAPQRKGGPVNQPTSE